MFIKIFWNMTTGEKNMGQCIECNGETFYEPPFIICKSCGLTLSRSEHESMAAAQRRAKLEKDFIMNETPRLKRHREYLDWWEGPKNARGKTY